MYSIVKKLELLIKGINMSTFKEIENLEGEIWKDLPDFEGLYQVSTKGRVKGFKYGKSYKPHILKPIIIVEKNHRKYKNSNGYVYVKLHVNGKCYNKRVHRLVAITFIPNPENKNQVNHIDGNTLNNHVENLEWSDGSENTLHARRILKRGIPHLIGERHGNAYLTWNDIHKIREDYPKNINLDYKDYAKMYNVHPGAIGEIVMNKSWYDPNYIPPKYSNYYIRNGIKKKSPRIQVVDLSVSQILTENQINEIRNLYKTGKYSQKELAAKYGVSRALISDVIHCKRCFGKV